MSEDNILTTDGDDATPPAVIVITINADYNSNGSIHPFSVTVMSYLSLDYQKRHGSLLGDCMQCMLYGERHSAISCWGCLHEKNISCISSKPTILR